MTGRTVAVISADPRPPYFRALYYLKKKEKIDRLGIFNFIYAYFNAKFWSFLSKIDYLITAVGPCHFSGILSFLLQEKGIKSIFYNSWPWWEQGKYAHEPKVKILEAIWKKYASEAKTVGVTKKATRVVEKLGGNAVHIPHSVDTTVFRPLSIEREPFALFVGRLVKEKGVITLLKVAKMLEDSRITIKFAGNGPLSHVIEKTSNAKYLGYVSKNELIKLYNQASVLVLPSIPTKGWTELFGIVLIEAMACATPVIATNCVGPREIVTDETGFLIKPTDKISLKNKIEEICYNPSLGEELGKRGRKYVMENYDIGKIAKGWSWIFNSV